MQSKPALCRFSETSFAKALKIARMDANDEAMDVVAVLSADDLEVARSGMGMLAVTSSACEESIKKRTTSLFHCREEIIFGLPRRLQDLIQRRRHVSLLL